METKLIINRRTAFTTFGAATLAAVAGLPGVAFGQAATQRRLVVLLLRGAMDGLSAVPAYGDPDFERERKGIALPPPGNKTGALKLDSFFGLHPWLPAFHKAFLAGQMTAVHAIATPYRERSHFDAQHLLENGSDKAYGLSTGWLNRALHGLASSKDDLGISITSAAPVIMQGSAPVGSWSPSELPQPGADLIGRVERLYGPHADLHGAFVQAKAANQMVGAGDAGGFAARMSGAARFLKQEAGPRVAFIDSAGWDTHAGQSAEYGALYQAMTGLNAGLEAFQLEIGPVWSQTAVLIFTEFGRTVAMNGSNGTDHGTGGAAFLVGGAVKGGRVIADWPGLKVKNQHEGRDLKPTLDMRALMKGVLRDHLGVDPGKLEADVFPNSAKVRPLEGLFG